MSELASGICLLALLFAAVRIRRQSGYDIRIVLGRHWLFRSVPADLAGARLDRNRQLTCRLPLHARCQYTDLLPEIEPSSDLVHDTSFLSFSPVALSNACVGAPGGLRFDDLWRA
jgi:hypothetical protein